MYSLKGLCVDLFTKNHREIFYTQISAEALYPFHQSEGLSVAVKNYPSAEDACSRPWLWTSLVKSLKTTDLYVSGRVNCVSVIGCLSWFLSGTVEGLLYLQ